MKTSTWRGGRAAGSALAAVLLVGALSGCAVFFKSPTVRIADVRVASVGLSGGTAEIALDVLNPNGRDLKAKDVHYRFSFADPEAKDGWKLLSEGTHEAEIVVRGNDSTRVILPVSFSYTDLGRALGSLLNQGALEYRLDGDVQFDAPLHDPRVRFDRRGTVRP
jgi:LEA14-like dessication related protein